MAERIVRIGGASGAWGDSPGAVGQLLGAKVDYLVMDFLAEVTMSLLARARMKNAEFGFPPDFVAYLEPHLAEIARRGIKVVSNAGGVNPQGCKAALERAIADLGLGLRVAVVLGDDLMAMLETFHAQGVREAETGESLPAGLLTANAYLGALPIAHALGRGADIVVTGRCADSALALGALIHEFGWRPDDHDRLAAGSLVGHVLECGPQATGGIFSDWDQVPDWQAIGYPIAECRADGRFVLTKPAGTGGIVAPAAAAEQVLYEIGDPADYLLPDVGADFSGVRISRCGPDRVLIEGARGRPPTSTYKVSATHQDGWRAVLTVPIVGPDAAPKAERTAAAIIARARALFRATNLADFAATHIEALGAEASYGPHSRARQSREVLLRLVVDHADRAALELFAREAGAIGISFAPGTTGIYSGRPKPAPIVKLFTFLVEKADLPAPTVQVGEAPPETVEVPVAGRPADRPPPHAPAAQGPVPAGPTVPMALGRLAHARSGDKGNASNVAVFARRPEYLPFLRRELTAQRMAGHFAHLVDGPVRRYEAPGLNALNFVMDNALGGGGMASRRIDPQGKAYGQMALEIILDVPEAWAGEGGGGSA
jgi:hypothetical protein